MQNLKLILSVLLLVLTSCGYKLAGGGYLNSDVTHVAVEMMEDKSQATGAGVIFTNALIKEISEKTDTKIVDDTTKAIAILKGRINSITFATLSRSTTESVVERRISASVDMQLVDQGGQIIWSVKNFVSKEEYKVSDDKNTDDSNKIDAVVKISIRNAEKLVTRMVNRF
ncbi:MAG: LPS assembly lipoprotein LptE [Deltaproteobacteria bacterium]|jgi:outer membrane lipopolysaccharide assembly protein LptE/RlpB|nr:LPS assembly lipoprotein LptE [Deltaproteobacteria bacterium]